MIELEKLSVLARKCQKNTKKLEPVAAAVDRLQSSKKKKISYVPDASNKSMMLKGVDMGWN